MNVNFIYLVNNTTPSFKIVHYIVVKSWLVNNESCKVIFWTNKPPTYSTWFYRLVNEFKDRISIKDPLEILKSAPNYAEEAYNKASCMTHKADILRLLIILKDGGVYSDLDHICLSSLEHVFTGDKPVYPCELDSDRHFEAIPNGIFYAPKDSDWIKDLLGLYRFYNPDSWNETSILKPTELYFKDPSRITVFPAGLFDPVTYRYDDWHSFFFYNDDNLRFDDSFAVHISESVTKDILKYIDLKHIMTVKTNFTVLVRPFVEKYWDFSKPASRVSKYE